MNSPSDLALLRVYLPNDLLDKIHHLARATGQPVRKVVRGILELGIPKYVGRWTINAHPVYDDEMSDRGYQPKDGPVSIDEVEEFLAWLNTVMDEDGNFRRHEPPGGDTAA